MPSFPSLSSLLRHGRSAPQVADFLCPRTGELMEDPVTAEDKFNYERKAIEDWLNVKKKDTSPQTGQKMGTKLEPNKKLKAAIVEYQQAHRCDGCGGPATVISWPSHGMGPGGERSMSLGGAPAESSGEPGTPEQLEPLVKRARLEPGPGAAGPEASSMAEALSKFFRELDPLSDLLQAVLADFRPPRIYVLGDESAGKSTVLEQLANAPMFPRSRRFCTRLAIHLRLRRSAERKASLSVAAVQGDGREVEVEGTQKDLPQDLPSLENGWRFVQEEMTRLSGELGAGTGLVADRILVVNIHNENVPSVDLVDLPGIVGNPPEKEAQVKKIIDMQLAYDAQSGGHGMFLAVVPASGDVRPNTNMAMKLIQQHRLQDRTIGVFSKVDQCADSQVLRALVLNENTEEGETPESLGRIGLKSWMACMLKPPREEYLRVHNFERLFVQSRDETDYFQQGDKHLRRLLEEKKAGISCLVPHVEEAYFAYLHSQWKDPTMTKILDKLDEKEFEFKELGVVDEENRKELAQQEVQYRFRDHEGTPVRELYATFSRTVLAELSTKLRDRLTQVSDLTCAQGQLREQLQKLGADLERSLDEALQKVAPHFLGPLRSILEVKVELEEPVSITAAVTSIATQTVNMIRVRMRTKGQPREVVRKEVKDKAFIQLCHYPHYTQGLMQECDKLFHKATETLQQKGKQRIQALLEVDENSPWLRCEVNLEEGTVKLSCEVDAFVKRMETLVSLNLPSTWQLQQLSSEVCVGAESGQAMYAAVGLKQTIEQIRKAREAIRKTLFTDAEFEALKAARAA